MTTTMVKTGCRDGMNPTNDALYSDLEYRPSTIFCDVPVLPAAVNPGTLARVPVPRSTTCSMIPVSNAAVPEETDRRTTVCAVGVRVPPAITAPTTRGVNSWPPLAIELTAAAICNGVTAT